MVGERAQRPPEVIYKQEISKISFLKTMIYWNPTIIVIYYYLNDLAIPPM